MASLLILILLILTCTFNISYPVGTVSRCTNQLIAITEEEYEEIFNSTTYYVTANVQDGIHCIHSCQTGNVGYMWGRVAVWVGAYADVDADSVAIAPPPPSNFFSTTPLVTVMNMCQRS